MHKILVLLLTLGVVVTLYVTVDGYDKNVFEIGSYSANIVLALIQIGALVLIYSQLKHQKQLSVAQFISSIMEQLASQKDFHRKLENYNKITDIVDISGGLETSGLKDISKINIFLNKIKRIKNET